ncbi:MAG: hypothetical protein ACLVKR_04620 [Lachnospiraceae bacterium]
MKRCGKKDNELRSGTIKIFGLSLWHTCVWQILAQFSLENNCK